MTIALWIVGGFAIISWVVTLWVVISPPGDNSDARALGETLAIVPGVNAIVASLLWILLAAIHWI